MNFEEKVNALLKNAFEEDLGFVGDITTKTIFAEDLKVKALIKSKEKGVLSGAKLIEPAFKYFDPDCRDAVLKSDGDYLEEGSPISEITGSIHTVLATERIILNLLQRLSGIATTTHTLFQKIRHTSAKRRTGHYL
jgi:nicotinate-nucleotide pyrophosphorylase (carboxylating)